MQQQIDQLQREVLALEQQEQEVLAQAAAEKEAFRSKVVPYTTGLCSKRNEDMQHIQQSQDQQQHELAQQQNAMECQAAQNARHQQQLQQEYREAMAARDAMIEDVWNHLCAKYVRHMSEFLPLVCELCAKCVRRASDFLGVVRIAGKTMSECPC